MVVFGSLKRWEISGIVHPPLLAGKKIPRKYTTYSPCLRERGLYATDPTFYRNQKQPLIGADTPVDGWMVGWMVNDERL